MNSVNDAFWKEFEALQDRVVFASHDRSTLREVLVGVIDLVGRLQQHMASTSVVEVNLSGWAATFYQFAAELSLDLDEIDESIALFRLALTHGIDDLELRVGLIRVLCVQGLLQDACQEINLLKNLGNTFRSTCDAESAARVLNLVLTHPSLARDVEAAVLQDAFQSLANRGAVSIEIRENCNQVKR